jgi:hypothetical protein
MPYEISENFKNCCMNVVYEGRVSLESMQEARQQAARALVKRGWNRLLVDLRKAKPSPLNFDHYALYHQPSELLPGTAKIALLGSGEYRETWQYAENAAKLSGVNLRLFFFEEDAMNWLFAGDFDAEDSMSFPEESR